ncbi:MAG: APC family permease [Xenococcaceae cyanobacterium MO_167.B27]|nr:APC family permease [Xenococcaceae cyanobacterium MO_167.B27]
MTDNPNPQPQTTLNVIDAGAIIIGVVVGVGIFKTPALVAANVSSETSFLLIWLLGGLISLMGALCYGELATAYPHPGGEYHYLTRSFGKEIALLFAWARLSVMQTGSLALLAFVFGDYLGQLVPLGVRLSLALGEGANSIYAGLAVIILTGINALGIQLSKWLQNWLTAAKLLALLFIFCLGLALTSSSAPVVSSTSNTEGSYGEAMIFVLLSYGGWSEAAYLSAEIQDVQKNMVRVLVGSLCASVVVFWLVNFAYLKGLGLSALANSEVVAADLMRRFVGEAGAQFISLLIAVSALGAIQGTIFTGARTNYALGQDWKLLGWLGRWDERTQTPLNALILQGTIALALILLGTLTRSGFATMVEYTAPVFWFFLLLTTLSLFVLRTNEPEVSRAFCVPLYPLTPLLFCATCVYMLQASLTYTGIGALVGVVVLGSGVPLLLMVRH